MSQGRKVLSLDFDLDVIKKSLEARNELKKRAEAISQEEFNRPKAAHEMDNIRDRQGDKGRLLDLYA